MNSVGCVYSDTNVVILCPLRLMLKVPLLTEILDKGAMFFVAVVSYGVNEVTVPF